MIPHKFDGTDIIDSAKGKPWEEREDVAFFVGRMSGHSHIEVEGSHLLNPRMRGVEVAKRR